MQAGKHKTLYSELGIPESASFKEVRAAYLRLAKYIHPDKMRTDEERAEADDKMTRLNEVMEVLGDAERRAEYDRELALSRPATDVELRNALAAMQMSLEPEEEPRPWVRWPMLSSFVALGCLVLAGVAWILMREASEDQWWRSRVLEEVARSMTVARGVEERAAEKSGADEVRVKAAQRSDGGERSGSPDAPGWSFPKVFEAVKGQRVERVEKPAEAAVHAAPTVAAPTVAAPAMTAEVRVVERAPHVVEPRRTAAVAVEPPSLAPVVAARQESPHWNGIWRYQRELGGGVGGTFSPVSIEMQVLADGPTFRGAYKATYEATGKYPAEVEFWFAGQDEKGAKLRGRWKGTYGAEGEFEIRRLTAKVVEMNWWTTVLGKRKKALASGVARLAEGL